MSRLIKIADWTGEKRGNVVFVHGLGGHPYDTWRCAADASAFWPSWLAEDVKGLSVYSLGYVSPPTNWVGTAMPLLDEAAHALRVLLNSEDLKTGPITFVCHSLGGLMAKSIIRAAREQNGDRAIADFYARVRQVVFIATPHTGAGKATLLEWLSWLSWPTASARNLVANNPGLRDLNFGYRNLAEARAGELSHLVYYEMLDTLVGGIVAPASADPGLPNCLPTPIREDHITIAKPRRRDDLVYAETRALVSKLAPEPAASGTLRTYPVEPFAMEWSWKQLVPKAFRIGAVGLLALGLWAGVPWLRSTYAGIRESQGQIGETQTKTKVIDEKVDALHAKLEALALDAAREQGVPVETLRAILKEMGDAGQAADVAEIGRRLTAKAVEFKALTERLNQLTDADPEVSRLRKSAADELAKGRFSKADSDLAAAEARDLAGGTDLIALGRKKILSAAESRSERGAAALLRTNPAGYREAAGHFGEAARIALTADAKVALGYAYRKGEALLALGTEFGLNSALLEAIDDFRAMLKTVSRSQDPRDWAASQNNLGNALSTLGERESGTARLEESVSAYRAALGEWTRDRAPMDWAIAQNNLGGALRVLGERESGTALLEEAVKTYRAALEEWTRDRTPLNWAITQNNLGNALQALGERESGTARLEEAVAAYRAALEERRRDRVPLDWAGTRNNLGNALQLLGEREIGTARFEEAVEAYRAALEEWTRDRVPLNWALAQNNLGSALQTLGTRGSGTGRLEEAVTAFHAALEERTRDRVPLDWATTKNNLGNALRVLGERESGTARFEEAIEAYRAALEERTRDRVPLDWAATQNNLANALQAVGERESGTARLEEAIAAFRAALEERKRDRVPRAWAGTKHNLGAALQALGNRENGTARFEEAVAALREALEERTRERVPLEWASTQHNLGHALSALGSRESETTHLEDAVAAYRAALEERRRDRMPLDWASTQNNLGATLQVLGEREGGTARLEEAVTIHRAVLAEWTRDGAPLNWALAQTNLGIALTVLGERESGTARLEEAMTAYRAALEERTRDRTPLGWATSLGMQGVAMRYIADRRNDPALAKQALGQIETALDEMRRSGHDFYINFYESQVSATRAVVTKLEGKP